MITLCLYEKSNKWDVEYYYKHIAQKLFRGICVKRDKRTVVLIHPNENNLYNWRMEVSSIPTLDITKVT